MMPVILDSAIPCISMCIVNKCINDKVLVIAYYFKVSGLAYPVAIVGCYGIYPETESLSKIILLVLSACC